MDYDWDNDHKKESNACPHGSIGIFLGVETYDHGKFLLISLFQMNETNQSGDSWCKYLCEK